MCVLATGPRVSPVRFATATAGSVALKFLNVGGRNSSTCGNRGGCDRVQARLPRLKCPSARQLCKGRSSLHPKLRILGLITADLPRACVPLYAHLPQNHTD